MLPPVNRHLGSHLNAAGHRIEEFFVCSEVTDYDCETQRDVVGDAVPKQEELSLSESIVLYVVDAYDHERLPSSVNGIYFGVGC